jgi:hypothetical protein
MSMRWRFRRLDVREAWWPEANVLRDDRIPVVDEWRSIIYMLRRPDEPMAHASLPDQTQVASGMIMARPPDIEYAHDDRYTRTALAPSYNGCSYNGWVVY